jgi:hypothetical protein
MGMELGGRIVSRGGLKKLGHTLCEIKINVSIVFDKR